MDSEPIRQDLVLGGFSPPQTFLYSYAAAQDDLVEPEECLVLIMSVNETALDPRDQGQVDISDGVALVRIQDETGKLLHVVHMLLMFLSTIVCI